jgi:hypothetical protein
MAKSPKNKKAAGKPQRPKHPWGAARVAADRLSVILEFLPGSGAKGRMKFPNRNEFTRFVHFLGDVRLQMNDPTQRSDFKDLQKSGAKTFNPRWWADIPTDFSGSRIIFDHPMYGQVGVFFRRMT